MPLKRRRCRGYRHDRWTAVTTVEEPAAPLGTTSAATVAMCTHLCHAFSGSPYFSLLDTLGSLSLVTDAVHEDDALCLALTCRPLRDALWVRFLRRPAGDPHAGARVRTRDAAVLGTVVRLAWARGFGRPWPSPRIFRPGFFAVLANMEHPDFGPDVNWDAEHHLMAVHHLRAGAERLAAEFNAIDDRWQSRCGVEFIEGEKFGVVHPGNSLFEVHCRGRVDRDGPLGYRVTQIHEPYTATVADACIHIGNLPHTVCRTLAEAQELRGKTIKNLRRHFEAQSRMRAIAALEDYCATGWRRGLPDGDVAKFRTVADAVEAKVNADEAKVLAQRVVIAEFVCGSPTAQAGCGIAISGLPPDRAKYNLTYAPTGALVEGFRAFAAGPKRHLFRHPEHDAWHLANHPFDPATTGCTARIAAAGGPVPTGARTWWVHTGGQWGHAEVTVREVF
jgi:hypothetical protein